MFCKSASNSHYVAFDVFRNRDICKLRATIKTPLKQRQIRFQRSSLRAEYPKYTPLTWKSDAKFSFIFQEWEYIINFSIIDEFCGLKCRLELGSDFTRHTLRCDQQNCGSRPKGAVGQMSKRCVAASPKQPFDTSCSIFVGQRAALRTKRSLI